MDDRRQLRPASREVRRRQLTLEDGILEMVTKSPHGLKDLAQTLFVADVIAHKVGEAHGLHRREQIRPGTSAQLSAVVLGGQSANEAAGTSRRDSLTTTEQALLLWLQ